MKPPSVSQHQLRYLEELEKYKHIVISPGVHKHKEGMLVEVVSVDGESVLVRTVSSSKERVRTIHWCRKYLIRV